MRGTHKFLRTCSSAYCVVAMRAKHIEALLYVIFVSLNAGVKLCKLHSIRGNDRSPISFRRFSQTILWWICTRSWPGVFAINFHFIPYLILPLLIQYLSSLFGRMARWAIGTKLHASEKYKENHMEWSIFGWNAKHVYCVGTIKWFDGHKKWKKKKQI